MTNNTSSILDENKKTQPDFQKAKTPIFKPKLNMSLDEIANIKTEDQKIDSSSIDLEPIAILKDQFHSILEQLVFKLENKYSLHAAIKRLEYEIEVNYYKPYVANDLEEEHFNSNKDFILEFLRENCKNPTIQLKCIVDKDRFPNIILMEKTNEEKLQEMVSQNADLIYFIENLGLK